MARKRRGVDAVKYERSDPIPRHQCPCCDYVTLVERFGWDICPVCFWEDDGDYIDALDTRSPANHMTLRQGRANFKEFGACEKSMVKNVLSVSQRKRYTYLPRDIT